MDAWCIESGKESLTNFFKNDKFQDFRGKLRITYDTKFLKKKFIYEYVTYSKKNVIRGFHFQYKFGV